MKYPKKTLRSNMKTLNRLSCSTNTTQIDKTDIKIDGYLKRTTKDGNDSYRNNFRVVELLELFFISNVSFINCG